MRRFTPGLLVLLACLTLPALTLGVKADDNKDTKNDDGKGWVQLFNGKDLSGWEVYPRGTGPWKVKDGILVGTGPRNSHLFTKKDDYDNFVYRVVTRISDGGNSGQYFRAQFGPGYPKGYEAQINSTHVDPIKSGSLYPSFPGITREDRKKLLVFKELVKPDTWFTQEVTAVGNHIIIKVNGQKTVDFHDKNNTYLKGRFALQLHDPTRGVRTKVEFKKIEYKPLPANGKE